MHGGCSSSILRPVAILLFMVWSQRTCVVACKLRKLVNQPKPRECYCCVTSTCIWVTGFWRTSFLPNYSGNNCLSRPPPTPPPPHPVARRCSIDLIIVADRDPKIKEAGRLAHHMRREIQRLCIYELKSHFRLVCSPQQQPPLSASNDDDVNFY